MVKDDIEVQTAVVLQDITAPEDDKVQEIKDNVIKF